MIGRAVVAVVNSGLPAVAIRLVAGVLQLLAAVDRVCAMACNSAGDIPTVQLVSDDCRSSIIDDHYKHTLRDFNFR